MKLFGRNQKGRAIAMTEYLIILAIIAIAAIAVVGLFGKQIKEVFYRNTSTLGGTDAGGGKSDTITGDAETEAGKTKSMKDFDKDQNK